MLLVTSFLFALAHVATLLLTVRSLPVVVSLTREGDRNPQRRKPRTAR